MKAFLTTVWIISVIIAGFIGYAFGRANNMETKVLEANTTLSQTPTPPPQLTPVTSLPAAISPTMTTNNTKCAKTGFAQKWEYLTAYVLKANDSLQSIATEQLHDASRVNELLRINGVGPLVVGDTLYLPPSSVTKSSGNLKQVYGKLLSKSAASWKIGLTNDAAGQGLLIPSYWFENVENKNAFSIGDCITIFFDDGNTVYTVNQQ